MLGVRVAIYGRTNSCHQCAVQKVSADKIEQEQADHQREIHPPDLIEEIVVRAYLGQAQCVFSTHLFLDHFGSCSRRLCSCNVLIANDDGLPNADNGECQYYPNQELGQSHSANAYDFTHHELEGPHRADHDFNDAVRFFFNHPAHHRNAVQKNEEEDKDGENLSNDRRKDISALRILPRALVLKGGDDDGCFQPAVIGFGEVEFLQLADLQVLLEPFFELPLYPE